MVQQDARVVLRRQNSCLQFSSGNADAKILSSLIMSVSQRAISHNTIGIVWRLDFSLYRPTFKDNDFIELFSLCMFMTTTPDSGLAFISRCSRTKACWVMAKAFI